MNDPKRAPWTADEGRLEAPVGRPAPERAGVDALLADPSYYEPRIAKTPLARGCYECAWGKVAGCWRCGSR